MLGELAAGRKDGTHAESVNLITIRLSFVLNCVLLANAKRKHDGHNLQQL